MKNKTVRSICAAALFVVAFSGCGDDRTMLTVPGTPMARSVPPRPTTPAPQPTKQPQPLMPVPAMPAASDAGVPRPAVPKSADAGTPDAGPTDAGVAPAAFLDWFLTFTNIVAANSEGVDEALNPVQPDAPTPDAGAALPGLLAPKTATVRRWFRFVNDCNDGILLTELPLNYSASPDWDIPQSFNPQGMDQLFLACDHGTPVQGLMAEVQVGTEAPYLLAGLGSSVSTCMDEISVLGSDQITYTPRNPAVAVLTQGSDALFGEFIDPRQAPACTVHHQPGGAEPVLPEPDLVEGSPLTLDQLASNLTSTLDGYSDGVVAALQPPSPNHLAAARETGVIRQVAKWTFDCVDPNTIQLVEPASNQSRVIDVTAWSSYEWLIAFRGQCAQPDAGAAPGKVSGIILWLDASDAPTLVTGVGPVAEACVDPVKSLGRHVRYRPWDYVSVSTVSTKYLATLLNTARTDIPECDVY